MTDGVDDFEVHLTLDDDGFHEDRVRYPEPAGPVLGDDDTAPDGGTEPVPGRAATVPGGLEAPGTGTDFGTGTGTGEPSILDAGVRLPTRAEKAWANITDSASEAWDKSGKKPGGIATFLRAEPPRLHSHAWQLFRIGGYSKAYDGGWRYAILFYEWTIGLGMVAFGEACTGAGRALAGFGANWKKVFANPLIGMPVIAAALILIVTYLILS